MAELTGQTFAGFEIVAKLGEGGMGAVYKARQPLLDRFVALKVMSQQFSGDSTYIARFIREAASAAKLSHPNMVQVHTAGEQGGVYYIVMEFVEGESLRQRLKRVGRLEAVEAIAITLYVAQALQVAWNKAHLIHRDIKPDNIFLSNAGEIKVGDLGLAKSVGGETLEMTQSGVIVGSPHYMSPEQARGLKQMDFRTDIYSLGCTLYQLVSGSTPYQADETLALILKHVNDPTPDLQATMPNCSPALVALIDKMMAKDRNARHGSYEELITELWQVSDIIRQQQSAATATMTPAAATASKPAILCREACSAEKPRIFSVSNSSTHSQLCDSGVRKFEKPIRVAVHFARFARTGSLCYFINVTNLCRDRDVEITHVWINSTPELFVQNRDRLLPKRLRPYESWETWIPLVQMSEIGVSAADLYHLGRIRISTGEIVASVLDETIPSEGTVPGGTILEPP